MSPHHHTSGLTSAYAVISADSEVLDAPADVVGVGSLIDVTKPDGEVLFDVELFVGNVQF